MTQSEDGTPTGRRAWLGFGLVMLGLSIAASLCLAEVVVRAFGLGTTYLVGDHQIRLDRDVLYRNVSDSSPELNRLGYRERDFAPTRGDAERIFLVGDSFVAAWGVPQESMVSRVLERRLGDGYEVYAMGITGYGPDQALLRLLEEGFAYHPDRIVLVLFAANDFNDLAKNELFGLSEDRALVRTDANPVSRFVPRLQVLAFARLLAGSVSQQRRATALFELLFHDTYDTLPDADDPAAARKTALMRAILARFRDESRQRDVGFAVVIIPSSWGIENFGPPDARPASPDVVFRNEEVAASLCRELGIPYVDLTEALRGHPDRRLYLADGHWTVAGHALAAEAVAESLFPQASGSEP